MLLTSGGAKATAKKVITLHTFGDRGTSGAGRSHVASKRHGRE